jgi:ribonuclease Z
VHIPGAGTPTPTPERWGPAYAVEIGGEYLMSDWAPAATWKLVKAGIFPTKVDYLTRNHFDHDVDYPAFLLCRWDQSACALYSNIRFAESVVHFVERAR